MAANLTYRFINHFIFCLAFLSFVNTVSYSSWFTFLHGSIAPVVPLDESKYDFFRRFAYGYEPAIFHTFFAPSIGYKKESGTGTLQPNGESVNIFLFATVMD